MTRKTLAVIFSGAAALALASAAAAVPLDAQPGAWKVTVSTTRNGKSIGEPKVSTTCITRDQLDNLSDKLAKPRSTQSEECTRASFDQTATTVDWKYQCKGEYTIYTIGSLKFDSPTHYSGTMKTGSITGGQTVDTVSTIDAVRTGECTGNEPPAGSQ